MWKVEIMVGSGREMGWRKDETWRLGNGWMEGVENLLDWSVVGPWDKVMVE